MFIKSLDPAGTWLIDNETVYPRDGSYRIDYQWLYSLFLFSFFSPLLFFNGSEASKNCSLFFLRKPAKRIGPFSFEI